MKKIIALMLVLSLSAFSLVACGKKDYTLAVAIDSSVDENNKVSNYVVALVLDKNDKIEAVKLDCFETTITAADGAIANVESVTSKVALGDNYKMTSGNFAQQTKAFEDAIIGKTAEEVANLDLSLVTGCTMPYTPLSFKSVIAKAFASSNKTEFTAKKFTLSIGGTMDVKDGKASITLAGVISNEGKIIASNLDTAERTFTLSGETITADTFSGSKVELGENYKMTSGTFAQQADAFESYVVGKTSDEIKNLDFTLITGCTMPYSVYSFQAVLLAALANAQ